MPFYRCFVRGENFRFLVDGAVELTGFYATRWVEAANPADAENRVVAIMKCEPELQKPDWHDGTGPGSSIYIEKIEEADEFDMRPGTGFVFFREET